MNDPRRATAAQVEAIQKQWTRVFGTDSQDGPGDLHQYTRRTEPRLLLWSEAQLYLDLLRTRPDRRTRPPMTEADLARRITR